jgi:hypothetical protein
LGVAGVPAAPPFRLTLFGRITDEYPSVRANARGFEVISFAKGAAMSEQSEWLLHWDGRGQRISPSLLESFIRAAEYATGLKRLEFTIVSSPFQREVFEQHGYNLIRRDKGGNGPPVEAVTLKGTEWLWSVDIPCDQIRLETPQGVCCLTNLNIHAQWISDVREASE